MRSEVQLLPGPSEEQEVVTTYPDRWWWPVAVGLLSASACGESQSPCSGEVICDYRAVASGRNVSTHKNPADTAAQATVVINASGPTGRSYTFTYVLDVAPHGTVNAIRILQGTVTKGTICTSAPCAARGPVTEVTDTTLYRLLRNVALTVRVYTDSDPAGGAEGAIIPFAP